MKKVVGLLAVVEVVGLLTVVVVVGLLVPVEAEAWVVSVVALGFVDVEVVGVVVGPVVVVAEQFQL